MYCRGNTTIRSSGVIRPCFPGEKIVCIVRCSNPLSWYKDFVGQEFTVVDNPNWGGDCWTLAEHKDRNVKNLIEKDDSEVICEG